MGSAEHHLSPRVRWPQEHNHPLWSWASGWEAVPHPAPRKLEEPLPEITETPHISELAHPYLSTCWGQLLKSLILAGSELRLIPFISLWKQTSKPFSPKPQGLAHVRIKAPRLTGLTQHKSSWELRNSRQKLHRWQVLARMWRNGNLPILLVRM